MNEPTVQQKQAIEQEYREFLARRRARLKCFDFSIFCTNCIGGVMYHDLGLEFLSPTINLTIGIKDFIKMAKNLKWYMDQPLEELESGESFPVARLGTGDAAVQVNFLHYGTFQDAREKWEERKRKINWDRIVLITTDRNNCDYSTLRLFDELPYPNKLAFTHVDYPELSSAFYFKGFEDQPELGTLTDFKPQFFKRRYMDSFDYVTFLNNLK